MKYCPLCAHAISSPVSSGIKLCAVVALPASFGMCIYSREILELLFAGEDSAIALASPLLSVLGLSVLASCLAQITNSVLQANGKILCPIISMTSGLIVKATLAYCLVGNARVGAMGAPISTLLCNLTAVLLNVIFVFKYTSLSCSIGKIMLKPLAVTAISSAASVGAYLLSAKMQAPSTLCLAAAIATCAVLYLALLIKLGVLDAEEYKMLPLGGKINRGNKNEQRRKNYRTLKKGKISV